MASTKQKKAARRNIKKAATVAKKKKTLSHLPKKTKMALSKEGANAVKKTCGRSYLWSNRSV